VFPPGLLDGAADLYDQRVPDSVQRPAWPICASVPDDLGFDVDAILKQIRSIMDRDPCVQYVFLFTLAAGIVVLLRRAVDTGRAPL